MRGNAVGVICMMAWSTNFIVVDDLLAHWHPLLLTPMRSGFAAVTLCLAALAVGRGRELLQIPVSHMVWAGGVGLTAANLALVWGQYYVDPVSTAIIISSLPAISAAFGWFAGTERLSLALSLGIALAIAGGAIASLGLQSGAAGEGSIVGALVIAAGAIVYVWYTRTFVAICPDVSALAKAAVCMTVSTLMSLIIAEFAVLVDAVPLQYAVTQTILVKLWWLGGFAVGISTVLWFVTGRMVGVTIAAMHHNLVPFYVMIMALALGGSISAATLAGAALVVAGAVLAQLPGLALKPRLWGR